MNATTVLRKDVTNTPGSGVSVTLTRAQSGQTFTNYGATGTVTYNLPANPEPGDFYEFVVAAAFGLVVDPSSGDSIIASGSTNTAGDSISADDEGEKMVLLCIADGIWLGSTSGTWTQA